MFVCTNRERRRTSFGLLCMELFQGMGQCILPCAKYSIPTTSGTKDCINGPALFCRVYPQFVKKKVYYHSNRVFFLSWHKNPLVTELTGKIPLPSAVCCKKKKKSRTEKHSCVIECTSKWTETLRPLQYSPDENMSVKNTGVESLTNQTVRTIKGCCAALCQ